MKPRPSRYPAPLEETAFHGLAGDIVRVLLPHTEADPAALLGTFLVAFGNACGRGPGFKVGATPHGTNENALIVGTTAGGRKGSSWDAGARVVQLADPVWASDCVASGLSTGEGLIHRVRDSQHQTRKDGQQVAVDPGVIDKRLMVIETEFAQPLAVMKREGNTLSPLLRAAWDGKTLSTMTRTLPIKATDPHVSVIGHITPDELRRQMTRMDMASGLANRFLFICSTKSKSLPDGGHLSDEALMPLVARTRDALVHAAEFGSHAQGGAIRDIGRTTAAAKLWAQAYDRLDNERPGIYGAATARGAPHVSRLAVVYALLDGADVVDVPHLRAAWSVWRYCLASARFIFGAMSGNSTADELLNTLRASGPNGLTRTQIRDQFSRHRTRDDIAHALGLLSRSGMVRFDKNKTGGRPVERWWAT